MQTFKPSWIPKRAATRPQTERDAVSQAFYQTAGWRELSLLKRQQQPLCEVCLTHDRTRLANMVHHVKPITEHPELALDIHNCQSICYACHNREHKAAKVAGDNT